MPSLTPKFSMDTHPQPRQYDVFLSHHSADKPAVEVLARRLRKDGIRVFLDKWHLVPGMAWQRDLEEALAQSTCAAIFFGTAGCGAWHHEEMQLALNRAARSHGDYRVIPVLLPGAEPRQIEGFLELRTWVDFRAGLDDQAAYGRLVAGVQGIAPDAVEEELPDEPRPYRGLDRYEAADHPFFFGRDDEIRRLSERLRDDHCVAVVGASGSGKSSLVRAGLSTDLAEQIAPGIRDWQRINMVPGDDPLLHLATQLVAHVSAAERPGLVRTFRQDFEQDPRGLVTALATLFPSPPAPILLLVDQLEELVTHRPSNAEHLSVWRERSACFAANLRAAYEARLEWLRIVLTTRADFIGRFVSEDFPDLRALLERRQFWLGEMTVEDLRAAIALPAKRRGAFFEKGLVDTLIRDVRGQSGSLPLLADVLHQLWIERRGPWMTIDAYEASGGLGGGLDQRAQSTFEHRLENETQRRIAKHLFLRLTTLGQGAADTRRRVTRDELYPRIMDRAEVDRVIETLAHKDVRLLRADADSVEVTHEAVIQNWRTLRQWLSESRTRLRQHDRLSQQAKAWADNSRQPDYLYRGSQLREAEAWASEPEVLLNDREDEFLSASIQARERERRSQRRNRRLSAGLAVALLMLLGFGLQWRNYDRAVQQLSRSGYPRQLYGWQHQLTELELKQPVDLDELDWLKSDSLQELRIKAATDSASIHGIPPRARLRSLTKLTIDLGGTDVGSLNPLAAVSGLERLTLAVNGTERLWDFEFLCNLDRLQELNLDLADSHSVAEWLPWGKMNKERQLRLLSLNMKGSRARDSMWLRHLGTVRVLKLALSDDISDLGPVADFCKSLDQLEVEMAANSAASLLPVAEASELSSLTIVVRGSVSPEWQKLNLDPKWLEKLPKLEHLSLNGEFSTAPSLQRMTRLKSLELESNEITSEALLGTIPPVESLTLTLRRDKVHDLRFLDALQGSLRFLVLNDCLSNVQDWSPLAKLAKLERLTIQVPEASPASPSPSGLVLVPAEPAPLKRGTIDLAFLAKLSCLRHLEIHLARSQPANLEWLSPLAEAARFEELILHMEQSPINDLKPIAKLKSLQRLTLNLDGSRVSLNSLAEVGSQLTALTLDVSRSQGVDLEDLPRLDRLETLALTLCESDAGKLLVLGRLKRLETLDVNIVKGNDKPGTSDQAEPRGSDGASSWRQYLQIPQSLKRLRF